MKKMLFLFFLAMPSIVLSQKHLYIKTVAGNYWMHDMKRLQNEIEASVGNGSGDVRSFPVSVQGEIGFDFSVYDRLLRTIRLGGYLNYTQTNGSMRYSYAGGLLNFQQKVRRITLGGRALYNLREQSSIYCKVGLGVTQVSLETVIRTNSSRGYGKSAFPAGAFILEPGYEWRRNLDRLEFAFNAGYELNVNGRARVDGKHYIVDTWERPLKVDLSGFRVGAGVGIKL